jgi:hypothetical protein
MRMFTLFCVLVCASFVSGLVQAQNPGCSKDCGYKAASCTTRHGCESGVDTCEVLICSSFGYEHCSHWPGCAELDYYHDQCDFFWTACDMSHRFRCPCY